MGARGCFLTPAAKASHKPAQAGQRGDLALPAVDLPDFFFFESVPKVYFFVYAAQFLHRLIIPSVP